MGITPSSDRRLVLAPFGLGIVFAIVFVLVVTTATRSLQPHHLPVGLVAPAPIADRVQTGLDSRAPGAFDVHRYGSEADARQAILDNHDDGALVVQGPQARVLIASAQGQAPTSAVRTVLTGIASAAHLSVTVEDVRPLPSTDPTGMLAALLLIPLILASLLGGVAGLVAPSVPTPARLGLLLVYAAAVGLGVTLTVRLVEGGLSADYWAVGGVTSLFVLAMAATVTCLQRIAGLAGLGLAVLTLLVFGLPTAGIFAPAAFLPDFYRVLSENLPPGAAVTALRDLLYLGGAGLDRPLTVLSIWAGAALVLTAVADLVRGRAAARGPAGHPLTIDERGQGAGGGG
jgi:hypothetical protein